MEKQGMEVAGGSKPLSLPRECDYGNDTIPTPPSLERAGTFRLPTFSESELTTAFLLTMDAGPQPPHSRSSKGEPLLVSNTILACCSHYIIWYSLTAFRNSRATCSRWEYARANSFLSLRSPSINSTYEKEHPPLIQNLRREKRPHIDTSHTKTNN
jgi:hypothetical protein